MPLNITSISHPASFILLYEFVYYKGRDQVSFTLIHPSFFVVALLSSCFIPEVGALTHHHVGDFLKTGL